MRDARPSPGTVIDDRFLLLEQVGRGAMGDVWRARDSFEETHAAVKILRDERSDLLRVRERFEREGRILSELRHPHLARLRAWRVDDDDAFLALDFVEGPTLTRALGERADEVRPLELARVRAIFTGIASGLEAAHAAGVVHRDLKPGNILLSADPRGDVPVIVDFGAAKIAMPASESTTIGRVIGSWLYMAPEQIRGEAVDARCDLFALGVILFELLTLRRPFVHGEDNAPLPIRAQRMPQTIEAGALLQRIMLEETPRPSRWRPDLAARVDALIARALAPDREARFQSAAEMLRAVHEAFDEATQPPAGPQAETRTAELERTPLLPTRRVFFDTPLTGPPARSSFFLAAAAVLGLVAASAFLVGVLVARRSEPPPPSPVLEISPTRKPEPEPEPAHAVAVEPATEPTIEPATKPAPEQAPETTPVLRARTAPPKQRPKTGLRDQAAAPQTQTELSRAIAAASADPDNAERRSQLRRAIAAAAATLTEPAAKLELERCLAAAEFHPGAESLLACARALDQRALPK